MGKIIIFSAPSGAGKTTIVRNALKEFPELIFSISATTREKRGVEKEGVDYFFLSEKDFLKKIENDEFVEWETFYGYYYGSLKNFVNEQLINNQSIVFELDVKGALKIKETYPEAVSIFIMPPSLDELKTRLKNRKTENDKDLKKRFERAEMEMEHHEHFDYIVINDNLENAKKEVYNILNKILEKEK